MRPTSSCSLQFNAAFGEYALLDNEGELLEAGKLRMTKAALWNRFAALPPSAISVNYDSRFLWAVELLTQMGHAIIFEGSVPEQLRPGLLPATGASKGRALLCGPAQDAPGIFFLVDGDGERIVDAHYLVGPVTAATKLASLAEQIPQHGEPDSAQDSACRLYQLLDAGVMAMPKAKFRTAVAAA